MKTMRRVLGLALVALTACSGSGGETPGDAGAALPGKDAGGTVKPLVVEALTGLDLVDKPLLDEGTVNGLVGAKEPGGSITQPTTLTINDVAVGTNPDGIWLLSAGTPPIAAAAGQPLKVKASSSRGSAQLDLPCPSEVTLTSPTEGSAVVAGSQLTVSWTGSLAHSFGPLYRPQLRVDGFSAEQNRREKGAPGANVKSLTGGETSAVVTVPQTENTGYLLELRVVGNHVDTDEGEGFCSLKRRVRLVKQ